MPWNSIGISLSPPASVCTYHFGPGGFDSADAARGYITEQNQYLLSVVIPFMESEETSGMAKLAAEAWLNRSSTCKRLLVGNLIFNVYEYADAEDLERQASIEAQTAQLLWSLDEIGIYMNPDNEEEIRRALKEKPEIAVGMHAIRDTA